MWARRCVRSVGPARVLLRRLQAFARCTSLAGDSPDCSEEETRSSELRSSAVRARPPEARAAAIVADSLRSAICDEWRRESSGRCFRSSAAKRAANRRRCMTTATLNAIGRLGSEISSNAAIRASSFGLSTSGGSVSCSTRARSCSTRVRKHSHGAAMTRARADRSRGHREPRGGSVAQKIRRAAPSVPRGWERDLHTV